MNWELGIAYYKRALKELLKRVENPSIFVFCVDKDFAQNFDIGYPITIVQSDCSLHYEDMILMAHCKHGILANSTYSWWAAYLISNLHKVIIAPSPWIHSIQGSDNIIPQSWIKVSSQEQ
ncbi:alpha-1,2-fucosyltransferase [Helicobacter himalayensis]|uniref:alpha-1,2-fucosyltransferase n=1 Tax=Helicobacter himalayensis TaxID=1591088 RepID=UPI003D6DB4E2